MADKKGQVTLRGRFSPGDRVRLVQVKDESVLRSAGGKLVEVKKVGDDGVVKFTGLEVGARFFVVGYKDGTPIEARATARPEGDEPFLPQAPVAPDVVQGAARHVVDPKSEPFGLRLAQEQVGDDVPQRSATPHGTAHPMDPEEHGPYPSQEDELYASGKVPQRSDTPLGQATPIHDRVSRQEETDGKVQQRSDTPQGVATPLPQGKAVDAVRGIESAEVKAAVGEPSQAEARGVSGLESALKERAAKQPKDAPPPAKPSEVAEAAAAAARDEAREGFVTAMDDAAPEGKKSVADRPAATAVDPDAPTSSAEAAEQEAPKRKAPAKRKPAASKATAAKKPAGK